MTLNTFIDVYFHMKNHYRKLRHVRSVIDCSPPKGRPRNDSTGLSSENSSKKGKSRSRSAGRPPTRRNPKDMPNEKSKSLGRPESSISEELKIYDMKAFEPRNEQHEYLQFSLRITEDIIKNDLYTNEEMKKVLASHFEANKGRLETSKMIVSLYQLCEELGIQIDDFVEGSEEAEVSMTSKDTIRNTCICPRTRDDYKCQNCECTTERQPPITCSMHGIIRNEKGSNTTMLQVRISQMPTMHSPLDESLRTSTNYTPPPNSTEQLEPNGLKEETPLSEGLNVKSSEVEILHEPQVWNTSKSEFVFMNREGSPNGAKTDEMASKAHCDCGSASCDPSTCEITEQKFTLVKDLTSTSFVMDDTQANNSPTEKVPKDASSTAVEIPVHEEPTTVVEEVKESSDKVTEMVACDCKKDGIEAYLEYFNKQFSHPKHVHQLACSHYMTSIAPIETAELSVQTCFDQPDFKRPKGDNKETNTDFDVNDLLQVPRSESLQTQYHWTPGQKSPIFVAKQPVENAQSDFIILEGPIYIPKEAVQKGTDTPTYSELSSCTNRRPHCTCPTQARVSPRYPVKFVPFKHEHRYDNLHLCSCNPSSHETQNYNDYDVTPQRDILLYDNRSVCGHTQNPSTCGRNNLLLGNRYDRLQTVNENFSHFYPTIATQVSSMDLLSSQQTYQLRSQEILVTPVPKWENTVKSRVEDTAPAISLMPIEKTTKEEKKTELDEVLDALGGIPLDKSTDSMEKRIQTLKVDLERFRGGHPDSLPTAPRSLNDYQPRERGVSISDEVELIKQETDDVTAESKLRKLK